MLVVSKKVEYSVVLVRALAETDEFASLAQVARDKKLPYRYTTQLARILREAGVVVSREGKAGGYQLVPEWKKKNLYDLLCALGEKKSIVKCMALEGRCHREVECQLKSVWQAVDRSVVEAMKKISIIEKK